MLKQVIWSILSKTNEQFFALVKVKNVLKSIVTLFRTSTFFKRFSCSAKEQTWNNQATTQLDKSKCFVFRLPQVHTGTRKLFVRLIKFSCCFLFYKKFSLCCINKQNPTSARIKLNHVQMRLLRTELSVEFWFGLDWILGSPCTLISPILLDLVGGRIVSLCILHASKKKRFARVLSHGITCLWLSGHNNRHSLQYKPITRQSLCYSAGDAALKVKSKLYPSVIWHCEVSIFLSCQKFKLSSIEI